MLKDQRPMFIGEFGPYINRKNFTHDNAVEKIARVSGLRCRTSPASAARCIWSMYFHHQDGGFYWHQIMTFPAVWSYH